MRNVNIEKRKDALEILRMDLASRLLPASVLCFVILCMILLASHNIVLDISLALAWVLLPRPPLAPGLLNVMPTGI